MSILPIWVGEVVAVVVVQEEGQQLIQRSFMKY